MKARKYRLISLYLPQYHPIPENDEWWGKGFTEWTNVGKARPLYRGHYQPHVPSELGYYDLRVPEVREAQAKLAQEYGIEGFCYWHYWFGNGKELLDRPFKEVLASKSPDFPFCLAWANESWRGFYHGVGERQVLIEQTYPSVEDHIAHFYSLLEAFKDHRYITVDEKPLFMIYRPEQLPDVSGFVSLWNRLAGENGLKGIYFVGCTYDDSSVDTLKKLGLDAVEIVRIFDYTKTISMWERLVTKVRHKLFGRPRVVSYKHASSFFVGKAEKEPNVFPTIIPNWDHSPRTGRNGVVFDNSTPELFSKHLNDVKDILDSKEVNDEHRIAFVKSWNEWAEGNYLEPDMKFGRGYLEAVKRVFGF